MTLFDRSDLKALLAERDLSGWSDQIDALCADRFYPSKNGNLDRWKRAWSKLPDCANASIDADNDTVIVSGEIGKPDLRETLMAFHPWRKGPFEFFGIPIDTEWRSDIKWQRIASAIDLNAKTVLDIGCGNGYYGWRMLSAGADLVIGCDPYLLYIMQFEVVRRYAEKPERHFILPLADTDLPPRLEAFDTTFSMGVLYHRTSPIDHLQTLAGSLKSGGQLILETLIVESDTETVLVPSGRYAKMKNVWFIPSISMLTRWLMRTGFVKIEVIDISKTTDQEQRRTEMMTFESLNDFLDPNDETRTIEGDPAPVRAVVSAWKR
ncbi:tRNA (mo5U34)-methyltransferase [Novipirellula aureliae]|uniref:tRNA (Mo5U34)-methyltransferase n=1 Tax=Novipirellula aureliae TaxID=2527966 RepID=A0A5C6E8Y1_9BACT|nr:tRNA 5-methoxyuridine(34)/uridine 5-oxyacetic acid(34) synthase CmoB [Novipirellula aureliae]TWU45462.1 tRNA (mo5U34)-methyltransferase [Novipirellula aureliae]